MLRRQGWIGVEHGAALADGGLDGLEIYHPGVDEPARRHFLAWAEQADLLVSGGSDEHGLRQP